MEREGNEFLGKGVFLEKKTKYFGKNVLTKARSSATCLHYPFLSFTLSQSFGGCGSMNPSLSSSWIIFSHSRSLPSFFLLCFTCLAEKKEKGDWNPQSFLAITLCQTTPFKNDFIHFSLIDFIFLRHLILHYFFLFLRNRLVIEVLKN